MDREALVTDNLAMVLEIDPVEGMDQMQVLHEAVRFIRSL